ncbi:MAG: elongation factor G [Gammaproteobacteria bacterium]|nr:elongation factor G [Gammaproteobacteria bacterium]
MPSYTTGDIRNVALVGHGGAGKTMLLEAMLQRAGVLEDMGSIERGSTVSDHEPEEKHHQHSLFSSVASFDHGGVHVNVIDTPGYPDFLGRALAPLAAVETAVVIIDAKAGVQNTTRRMMEAAKERGLVRLIVVNRIDVDAVDIPALVGQIRETFGDECLPINLPTSDGGVADCFFSAEAADTVMSSVDEAHTQLIDQVVEMDEQLMELYLEEGEDMQPERLHDAFGAALREGHLIPVCFTCATQGVGVEQLMHLIQTMMPSPAEVQAATFTREDGDEVQAVADPALPLIGHVFKVSIDPFVGKLGVFRIHQGSLGKDSQILVGDARKAIRVGHLFRLRGKETKEADSGVAGDICAMSKLDELEYEATLRDSHDMDGLTLTPMPIPAAMYGLAIQAKSRGDEQKISDTLHKMVAEDPSLLVEHNAVTNETVIKGLGDLHLRMTLERMRERYNVEVDTHPPKIAYKETIQANAEGHHRHKKQTGGAGQFGEVFLRVEPLARGGGFEFADQVVGGVIPSQFIPAVEKGVRQVLESGAVAGYPFEDVRVTVYDGKFHPVDSKEIAFVTAGKRAFLDAVSKAKPIVLEPIVNVDVTAPQENMGDIAGDLSGKRGRISGTTAIGGGMVAIAGQAPLSELESYQSELKSVTGGAGSYTIEFSHYDPVPRPVQQQLMESFKPTADDD